MATCEKCWRDAGGNPDEYGRLLQGRGGNPCTPEQQAGPDATVCPVCSRSTVHQYAGVCMICGFPAPKEVKGEAGGCGCDDDPEELLQAGIDAEDQYGDAVNGGHR